MKTQRSHPSILLMVPFTRPDYSGSGIHAFNFARFLVNRGYPVTLLTFNRNLQYKSREILEQVPIHRIAYFNRNLILKAISLISILPAYVQHIFRTDLVILYGAHIIAYEFLIVLGRLANKKIVFRSLLLGADDMKTLIKDKKGIGRRIKINLFRKIDLYFAIHPVFAEDYEEYVGRGENVLTCPQGVDTSVFTPSDDNMLAKIRSEYGIPESCFVILSAGFLVNRKGFTGAFRVLQKLDFGFRFVIAGEYEFGRGHFMKRYAQQAGQIRQAGMELLGERLILAGAVDSIRDYYRMADLVLINSISEGLPNTLLEAMASGKTVLVKDLPGIRYLVDHMETGVIYRNDTEMFDQLCMLQRETGLRMQIGKNAAQHIRTFASFETILGQLFERLNLN